MDFGDFNNNENLSLYEGTQNDEDVEDGVAFFLRVIENVQEPEENMNESVAVEDENPSDDDDDPVSNVVEVVKLELKKAEDQVVPQLETNSTKVKWMNPSESESAQRPVRFVVRNNGEILDFRPFAHDDDGERNRNMIQSGSVTGYFLVIQQPNGLAYLTPAA